MSLNDDFKVIRRDKIGDVDITTTHLSELAAMHGNRYYVNARRAILPHWDEHSTLAAVSFLEQQHALEFHQTIVDNLSREGS